MAGLKLKKVLLYALVILLVVSIALLFKRCSLRLQLYSLFFIGWNVHTLGNYTETEDGGTIPLNPKLADPCGTSENAFGSYQPIRFRINQDSGDVIKVFRNILILIVSLLLVEIQERCVQVCSRCVRHCNCRRCCYWNVEISKDVSLDRKKVF